MTKSIYITDSQITAANKDFHNTIADRYDERLELYHPLVIEYYQNLFDKWIFSRFLADKQISVLDVGCGTGYLEKFFTKKFSIKGIDVSPEMIKIARSNFPLANHSNISFLEQDVYSLSDSSDTYDIVMENSFLHHCGDYVKILKLMAGKVKKNGVLFLGMEPNQLVYKNLYFIVKMFRKLILKKSSHIEQTNMEDIAEYQIYHGNGINYFLCKKILKDLGFKKVFFFSSNRQSLAKICEESGVNLFRYFPNMIIDHTGYFTQLFHIVAYKD